jgi:hypothetical protein
MVMATTLTIITYLKAAETDICLVVTDFTKITTNCSNLKAFARQHILFIDMLLFI